MACSPGTAHKIKRWGTDEESTDRQHRPRPGEAARPPPWSRGAQPAPSLPPAHAFAHACPMEEMAGQGPPRPLWPWHPLQRRPTATCTWLRVAPPGLSQPRHGHRALHGTLRPVGPAERVSRALPPKTEAPKSRTEGHKAGDVRKQSSSTHAPAREPSARPPPLTPGTPSPSVALRASSVGQRGRTPTSPVPRGRDVRRNLPEPAWSETSLRMSPGCPSTLKQTVSPLVGKSTTKWGSPSAASAGRAGEGEKGGQ